MKTKPTETAAPAAVCVCGCPLRRDAWGIEGWGHGPDCRHRCVPTPASEPVSAIRAQRHTAQVLAGLLDSADGLPPPHWTVYSAYPDRLTGLVDDREALAGWAAALGVPVEERPGHDGVLRGYAAAARDGARVEVWVEVWAELDRPGSGG